MNQPRETVPWQGFGDSSLMGHIEKVQTTYDYREEPLRNDHAPLILIIDGTSLFIEKLHDGTIFLHNGKTIIDKFGSVDDAVECAKGYL